MSLDTITVFQDILSGSNTDFLNKLESHIFKQTTNSGTQLDLDKLVDVVASVCEIDYDAQSADIQNRIDISITYAYLMQIASAQILEIAENDSTEHKRVLRYISVALVLLSKSGGSFKDRSEYLLNLTSKFGIDIQYFHFINKIWHRNDIRLVNMYFYMFLEQKKSGLSSQTSKVLHRLNETIHFSRRLGYAHLGDTYFKHSAQSIEHKYQNLRAYFEYHIKKKTAASMTTGHLDSTSRLHNDIASPNQNPDFIFEITANLMTMEDVTEEGGVGQFTRIFQFKGDDLEAGKARCFKFVKFLTAFSVDANTDALSIENARFIAEQIGIPIIEIITIFRRFYNDPQNSINHQLINEAIMQEYTSDIIGNIMHKFTLAAILFEVY